MLPPDLTYGSYEFRDLTNTGIGSLFEGKVIYDKTYGHVAYGCAECCGFSTTVPWYNPIGVPIYTAVADGVNALNSCTNIFEDESSSFYNNWSSANTAIATVDKYGNHTGVAQGATTSKTQGSLLSPNLKVCPLLARTPGGSVNVQKPTSLSGPTFTPNNVINYTGQQLKDCTGDPDPDFPTFYGYERCAYYQLLDQTGAIMKAAIAIAEQVTVQSTNVGLTSHTANAGTNSAGLLGDQLVFGSATHAPATGNYALDLQTFTTTVDGKPVTLRINCLDYEATDVKVQDVTSKGPNTVCAKQ